MKIIKCIIDIPYDMSKPLEHIEKIGRKCYDTIIAGFKSSDTMFNDIIPMEVTL